MLRTRVLAGVLLTTLVALAAFDVAAVTALRRYLFSRTDSSLHALLNLYRPAPLQFPLPSRPGRGRQPPSYRTVGTRRGAKVQIVGRRLLLRPPILDQYYLGFLPRHGPLRGLLQGNPDLRPKLPAHIHAIIATDRGWNVTSSNGRAQLRLQAVRIGGGTLFATMSLASADKTIGRVRFILIVGSAAAAMLVVAGVTLVLRRGLRPIETMASQADRITAGDLTDRVSLPDSRTEVGRLGEALNGMLARIEAAMTEREASQELTRRFFADASHELRNPLASLRANAELYQQGVLTERAQVDEAMCRISLEAQRLSRLVDDMLNLARAGAQAHGPGSGLGLAIVAAIARAHDGTALATRNNPYGLRITLTVPAFRPASCPGPALTASR
jgi:two-component system OmpR family sensor kinase